MPVINIVPMYFLSGIINWNIFLRNYFTVKKEQKQIIHFKNNKLLSAQYICIPFILPRCNSLSIIINELRKLYLNSIIYALKYELSLKKYIPI